MTSLDQSMEDMFYESKHNIIKPYFKNLHNKFLRGQFQSHAYLDIWTYFPESIEWLILNRDLVIDAEEFEKVYCKKVDTHTQVGKRFKNEIVSNVTTISDIINREPYKSYIEQIPLIKYSLSNEVKTKLKLYVELIEFNRKKSLIREEWKNNQEKQLPIIDGIHQFTEEFKDDLVKNISNRYGRTELDVIITGLNFLGITIIDIESMVNDFENNQFNKYHESFFRFLHSCIHYGCGDYYHVTKFQFDEETLLNIKKKAVCEIIVPSRLPIYDRWPDQEILNIDNDLFFIKNTHRTPRKDGVSYGKIIPFQNIGNLV